MNTRFFARKPSGIYVPPVIDPEPNPIELIGGWGGVYNSGAGVTGGAGGTLRTYTNAVTMLNDYASSDSSTPEIYYYTGADNADIRNGQTFRQYNINSKNNKTLMCSAGQSLNGAEIRHTGCNNLIIRNIQRKGPYFPHSGFSGAADSSNRDAFTINSCIGVWVDHVHVHGGDNYGSNDSNWEFWDGQIDMEFSNYVTISNSIFERSNRGILIGYSDNSIANRGILNVTIRDCIIRNISQRGPRVRFGKIHLLNNLYEWADAWSGNPVFIGVGNECQIVADSNWFGNGSRLIASYDTASPQESGSLLRNNYIGAFSSSTSAIRSGNVTWRPEETANYLYTEKLPASAKAYVEQWAGAKYHLKNPIV